MTNSMRRGLVIAALLLCPTWALAGAGTITTKDASGTTKTFVVVTDGSGNFLASGVLCDQSAGANCASVKAASTAAAQTDLALVSRNPDVGTVGDSACATDNGSCTLAALVKRTNQNLTTLNTTGNAAIPINPSTLWTTCSYSNGVVSALCADLHGAVWADIGGINGVALLAGNGATGTGSIRNTLANDNTGIANWGHGATGATAPTGATQSGCRGASTDPTAVTDGQMVSEQCGLSGKRIVLPYAIKELHVRGSVTSTDTGAHTIIASAGGSLKNYITDWECSNSSATSTLVTFNDSASTVVIVPAGGGNNKSLHIPLVTAAATAFTFTSGTGVSTVYCSAQGYTGL